MGQGLEIKVEKRKKCRDLLKTHKGPFLRTINVLSPQYVCFPLGFSVGLEISTVRLAQHPSTLSEQPTTKRHSSDVRAAR